MKNSKLLDTISYVFLAFGFIGILWVMQGYVWFVSGSTFLPHDIKEILSLGLGSLGLFFLAYFMYIFFLGAALLLAFDFARKILKWSILFNLFFMTLSFCMKALDVIRHLINDESYFIFTGISGVLFFCFFYAFNLYIYFHLKELQAKPSLA